MRKVFVFLVLAPLLGFGQGVHFESGLSWAQVVSKARAENRYIFVDCYASWCGPCKMMDRDVYPDDSVGRVMNSFVCVRAQLDTSKKDDDAVKGWYAYAHDLMQRYKVYVFPTFLFFAPDGSVVHRAVGFQSRQQLIAMAADSKNPQEQYYTQLDKYRSGVKDYGSMRVLALEARSFGFAKTAAEIAKDYLHHYLDGLNDSVFFTLANLSFINVFNVLLSSRDNAFSLVYRHKDKADSVFGVGNFSNRLISSVIKREEIAPEENIAKKKKTEPNWNKIIKNINRKFGKDYAKHCVTAAKCQWYKEQKDWKNYTKYLVKQMAAGDFKDIPEGEMRASFLNASAWEIFLYSNKRSQLEKAVSWANDAIKTPSRIGPAFLDTKANLLYKLGKKDEAISLEMQATHLAPEIPDFTVALEKMRSGKPTWAQK